MGTFSTKLQVGNPAGGDMREVEALVDTGASHSMFPASLLDRLRIDRRSQIDGTLADGSEVSYWTGWALIGIEGEEGTCRVIFGPEGDESSVIGATTLQMLLFKVDPVREVLEPTTRVRL
ncbi:MAG: aspartyl protease family protein [Chloroflexota bacterium]|nr:aspartyl protease family protein [Chloroflexota bacterium]MDE2958940.1 aspartyl protease family protein [Chloroflexota bacterium]